MTEETLDGETVEKAAETLGEIANGTDDHSETAYQDAMEKGLNLHQKAVAQKYAGEGVVEVDSSRRPNFADQLAANARLPKTFVVDGVEFVVKTSHGTDSESADHEWFWRDDGFDFQFYAQSDGPDEIVIWEVEDGE